MSDEDFRWTRYSKPNVMIEPSGKDIATLNYAYNCVRHHNSGGSYSMAAVLRKGKPKAVGLNSLENPAILKSDIYPELCGTHAELNLWTQYPNMNGASIYVTGVNSKSRNLMKKTAPCQYCAAILVAAGARYVICYIDSKPVKIKLRELI